MSKDDEIDKHTSDPARQAGDAVAQLMNLAGPRAEIPAGVESRVHRMVREEWRTATSKKHSFRWDLFRWAIPAALAATILIVFTFNIQRTEAPLRSVGVVAQIIGFSSDASEALVIGDTIFAGSVLKTGVDEGLSLTLNGDISVRLAENTRVRIDQADDIFLLEGQVYSDSGERIYRDRHIKVRTAGGSATDVGTQFSVSYADARLDIAVREGRVDIVHEQSTYVAEAGDRLILRSGRDAVIDQVSAYDDSWNWAMSLAPGFEIEGHSLLDFLKWAARETGKTLVFSSDEARMAAMSTKLFGSVTDFTPLEALESVLSTTQFVYRLDEGSITITK